MIACQGLSGLPGLSWPSVEWRLFLNNEHVSNHFPLERTSWTGLQFVRTFRYLTLPSSNIIPCNTALLRSSRQKDAIRRSSHAKLSIGLPRTSNRIHQPCLSELAVSRTGGRTAYRTRTGLHALSRASAVTPVTHDEGIWDTSGVYATPPVAGIAHLP